MKVLFIYSDISGLERYGAQKYYSGLGSLSAVLKAAGHETELLYLQVQTSEREFLDQVETSSPDLVGFSATTHQYPYIEHYAQVLKEERPDLLQVCGGVHASLVPDQVTSSPAFDVIVVGEGEYPLRDLVDRLGDGREYTEIENLWVRSRGNLRPPRANHGEGDRANEWLKNLLRPLIDPLDELPYVDRELFGFREMLQANGGWADIMVARGCPYNCSYCCNPGLKRRFAGLGRYVRFRSVDHVMGELVELVARYGARSDGGLGLISTINFQDDVFTLDRVWTLDFCEAYGSQFGLPFWINTRVERIRDQEIVQALARAGCEGIRVGVENGDEALRKGVLKRTMSNDEIVDAFRLAQRHGLKTYTCNMIGIPGETPESIQTTIALNRELAPDKLQFSVFYPYPMTELHDTCVAQSLMKEGSGLDTSAPELSSYYGKESALNLPTLSDDQLADGYDRFEALRAELALKRASPTKHKLYLRMLALYRGDSPKLQRHLAAARRVRQRAARILGGRS